MHQQPIRIVIAAGARPNFMKVAPLVVAFNAQPETFDIDLIHTGQHYDTAMSDVFFADLGMRAPDAYLNAGSGTHGEQTAAVLVAFEKMLQSSPPDIVLVTGDVNSTFACALAARKLDIPVGHVEAGLRSRNWQMPEETNRVLTDVISDYLFTPSEDADENLTAEGIPSDRIHLVGNIMIDSLERALPEAKQRHTASELGLQPKAYGLITLHRPSNIDDPEQLREILTVISDAMPRAVFPVHPRTRKRIEELKRAGFKASDNIKLLEPVGYYDFMSLMMDASFVLTDSGGIQEETTYLQIPCMTLREETERPITISQGTNELMTLGGLPDAVGKVKRGEWKTGAVPHIVNNGADWYKQWGTEKSTGTKLFCVSGHVRRPGNYEVPMGFNFREFIYDICGGPPPGRSIKAVIPGGSSVPIMSADELDIGMDYEAMAAAGTMLGCGSVIVMDDQTDIVKQVRRMVDFYAHESCGQCTPCREGTAWAAKILRRIESGWGTEEDLQTLLDISDNMTGKTICVLSDAAAAPIVSSIQKFREEYLALIRRGENVAATWGS